MPNYNVKLRITTWVEIGNVFDAKAAGEEAIRVIRRNPHLYSLKNIKVEATREED